MIIPRLRHIILLTLLVLLCTARAQHRTIDSLKHVLGTNLRDTARMRVLQKLAEISPHGEWQQHNTALRNLAEKTLRQKKLSAGTRKKVYAYLASAYHNTGIGFAEQTKADEAFKWFSKALAIGEEQGIDDITGSAHFQMGNIYYRKGQYKKAGDHIYRSLKINEAIGNQQGVADALMSVGNLHQRLGRNEQALTHYLRSLSIQEVIRDTFGMSASLRNIAISYQEKKDLDRASRYFKKALIMLEAVQDPWQTANTMNNLGMLMQEMGKTDSALYYYREGLQQYEALQNLEGIAQSLYYLGRGHFIKQQHGAALSALERALDIAREINYKPLTAKIYRAIYEVLKTRGDHAGSLQAYEYYIALRDSIDNENARKALVEQKLRYEFEKKEILSKAESEKKINSLQVTAARKEARKNTWIIVLVAITVVMLISGYYLYKYFKQRSIIAAQNTHLLQQKLLVSQMNPHFIFNSLNAIQNYIFKQDSLQAGTYLARFADLMRMILEFSRKEYITLEQEMALLNHYLDLQQLRFEGRFEYTIETGEEIEPENLLIPPMLAQPFIENAIEHGLSYKSDRGKISVKINFEGERLAYEVEDNGVGMEKARQLKKHAMKKHESLAMIITRERMHGFGVNGNGKTDIEITDLSQHDPALTGVKVKLYVPYKQK